MTNIPSLRFRNLCREIKQLAPRTYTIHTTEGTGLPAVSTEMENRRPLFSGACIQALSTLQLVLGAVNVEVR